MTQTKNNEILKFFFISEELFIIREQLKNHNSNGSSAAQLIAKGEELIKKVFTFYFTLL